MNWKQFLQGVFMDNGSPSFSRVGTAVALGFACGWVTSIVRVSHSLPDFMGLIGFIGVLYGANVAGNVGKAFSKDKEQQ